MDELNKLQNENKKLREAAEYAVSRLKMITSHGRVGVDGNNGGECKICRRSFDLALAKLQKYLTEVKTDA